MSTTLSCGECGTPLRADQSWCSLCFAQVSEAFDPLTAPLDEVLGQVEPATQVPVCLGRHVFAEDRRDGAGCGDDFASAGTPRALLTGVA